MPARLSSRTPALIVVLAGILREHKWDAAIRQCACGWAPELHGRGNPVVLHPAHQAQEIVTVLEERGGA